MAVRCTASRAGRRPKALGSRLYESILRTFGIRTVEAVDRAAPIRGDGAAGKALEHLPILWGHLMGQSGSFGQARRAARCGAPGVQMAGKRRNAADEPLWPTEGRVLLSRGRVALLIRCPASHFQALLTTGQNNPGQMVP